MKIMMNQTVDLIVKAADEEKEAGPALERLAELQSQAASQTEKYLIFKEDE